MRSFHLSKIWDAGLKRCQFSISGWWKEGDTLREQLIHPNEGANQEPERSLVTQVMHRAYLHQSSLDYSADIPSPLWDIWVVVIEVWRE